jgi:type II secretory pathway component GspD/PulD (secretin)
MFRHFPRPAALLAACVLAAVAPPARAELPKQQLTRRVYQVFDLVVPPPNDVVVAVDPKTAKMEEAPKSRPTREDKLIRLIEQTIAPGSWSGSGGSGTLDYFPMTASLVVNQTLDVQEQVADLLAALRRSQDTEVALEVRVLSVPDETFARAGVEFDPAAGPRLPKMVFLNGAQVRRLLEVAKADARTNVEQLPRVTLCNGQAGTLDLTRPQPVLVGADLKVIGDCATVLPRLELLRTGLRLTARPDVSADRRFVKVELCVDHAELAAGPPTLPRPELARHSCALTACVPDGATVVLGGFKTAGEAEKECAPPVVNNIPYLNRLFANAHCGPEAQRVLMLVTPRVVVAEEKEEVKPQACRPAGASCPCPAASAPCAPACAAPRATACVPQVDIPTQTKVLLVELLNAYDRACAEGDAESAKKLARAALELDPTCFANKR